VVPALLQVLASDPSDETINSILVALGRIGEAGDAQPGDASLATVLTGYLDHASHVVNERATIALGVLGDASAAPTLAALARDTDMGRLLVERRSVPERLRAFAAYGLGLTAERSPVPDLRRFAIHHLVGLAEDDDAPRESRVAAILALGLARPQEQALSAPQEGRPPTSSAAALAVWLLDFMDGREGDALRSQVPYALARLVPALGREQRNGIQRRLVRALERRSNEPNGMRRASALALGRIADSDEDDLDRDARRQLMAATEKGDLGTRHFAYVALAQISGRAGDGDGAPLAGAEEARRFLRNELRRGSSQSRPWVALSLGLLGDSLLDERAPLAREDVDAMRDQLEDASSPATLGASSIGMGLCRYLNASDVLLEKLEEASDPTVRQHVALSLGLNGSHDAIGELRELMLDSYHRPQVLEPAAMALALLDHEPLVDELLGLEEECDCDVSRATIASALGYVGNKRAIEPLIAMLTDEEAHSRLVAMAADSLGRLADKEPRPFSLRLGGDLNYHEAPASLTDAWGWGILDLD